MGFHISPENQGQVVEVSYGWCGGVLYRRTEDRSDRSVVVRCLADPWSAADTDRKAAQLEKWDAGDSSPPAWLEKALDDAPVVDATSICDCDDEE